MLRYIFVTHSQKWKYFSSCIVEEKCRARFVNLVRHISILIFSIKNTEFFLF